MVKSFVKVIALMAVTAFSGKAQVHDHALGLRGGAGNLGRGGEISYQHGLGDANRLELDLGWSNYNRNNLNYSHTAIVGMYHWVWNIEGDFNWYAGGGARIGLYQNDVFSEDNGMTLGFGGQLGIEYDFNNLGAPLLLSLDTRPMFGWLGGNAGMGYGASFGLRYTF